MVTRKQIEQIVKLFKFKKRGEDYYFLRVEKHEILLYYFKDKPKGWRIQIGHYFDNSDKWVKRLEQPSDIIFHLVEYIQIITSEADQRKFRGLLWDLRSKV